MLLERTWGENPTNSSGEENDSLWEIKGLVWLLLKWGSIKRALKHLQSPAGAAAHFQGTSQGRICCNFVVTRILLDTGKIPNGKGTKVETEERCIQTRDNFFFFLRMEVLSILGKSGSVVLHHLLRFSEAFWK